MDIPPLLKAAFAVLLAALVMFSAVTSTILNTSFADLLVLWINTAFFRMFQLLALIVRTCLEFLQHNFLLPPHVTWVLIGAYIVRCSPPPVSQAVGATVAAPFRAVAQIWQVYLDYRQRSDDKIAALRGRVAELEADAELPEMYKNKIEPGSMKDQIIPLLDGATRSQKETEQLRKEIEDLRKDISMLGCQLERAAHENECLNNRINNSPGFRERQKEKEMYELRIKQLQTTFSQKNEEIFELSSMLEFHKTQLHLAASGKYERELESKINEKDIENERLLASNDSTIKQNQALSMRVSQLEPQAAMLNNIKELTHMMSESDDPWTRLTVTLFVHALALHGATLPEFGIDPLRFESYTTWAKAMTSQQPSPVEPVAGFRLSGTYFPLSGSFCAGGKVYGAGTSLLQRVLAMAQTSWGSPQYEETRSSYPNDAVTISSNSAHGSNLRGFLAPQSSDRLFGFNPPVLIAPSGATQMAGSSTRSAPATQLDTRDQPDFNSTLLGSNTTLDIGASCPPSFPGAASAALATNNGNGNGNGNSAAPEDSLFDDDDDDPFALPGEKKREKKTERRAAGSRW